MSYLSVIIKKFNELLEASDAKDIRIHEEKIEEGTKKVNVNGIFIVKGRKGQIRVNNILKAKISKSHNKNDEVSLSRAIFNSDKINFTEHGSDGKTRHIELISFEAPLFRRTEGKEQPIIKCDLIGIEERENKLNIYVIEVKKKGGNDTDISYAIPEVLAYSIVLGSYLSNEERRKLLIKQINVARIYKYQELKEVDLKDEKKSFSDFHIYPIVLAPEDYWNDPKSKLDEAIEKYKELKKLFNINLNDENKNIESLLSMPSYFVLSPTEIKITNIEKKGENNKIPELEKIELESFNSLEKLKEYLKNKKEKEKEYVKKEISSHDNL